MSDTPTPRTDFHAENISIDPDGGLLICQTPTGTHVPAEFARTLERENAALRASLLTADIDAVDLQPDFALITVKMPRAFGLGRSCGERVAIRLSKSP